MRPGDRDGAPPRHERGERLGPVQHAQPRSRAATSSVGLPDRGGDHHRLGVAQVRGVVPDEHLGAEVAELAEQLGVAASLPDTVIRGAA